MLYFFLLALSQLMIFGGIYGADHAANTLRMILWLVTVTAGLVTLVFTVTVVKFIVDE